MNKKVEIDPDAQSLEPKSDGSGAFNAASQVEQQPRDRASDYDMGKLLSLLDKLDIPGSEKRKREIKALVQMAATVADGIETEANYYLEIERRYEELEQAIAESNTRAQMVEEENLALRAELAAMTARARKAETRAGIAEEQAEDAELKVQELEEQASSSVIDLAAQNTLIQAEVRQLRKLQDRDKLTGLKMEHSFNEELESLIKAELTVGRRAGDDEFYAIFYVDINQLKAVNDALGEAPHGDRVISEFAIMLQSALRAKDKVYRRREGGDEFMVIAGGDESVLDEVQSKIAEAIAGFQVRYDLTSDYADMESLSDEERLQRKALRTEFLNKLDIDLSRETFSVPIHAESAGLILNAGHSTDSVMRALEARVKEAKKLVPAEMRYEPLVDYLVRRQAISLTPHVPAPGM